MYNNLSSGDSNHKTFYLYGKINEMLALLDSVLCYFSKALHLIELVLSHRTKDGKCDQQDLISVFINYSIIKRNSGSYHDPIDLL